MRPETSQFTRGREVGKRDGSRRGQLEKKTMLSIGLDQSGTPLVLISPFRIIAPHKQVLPSSVLFLELATPPLHLSGNNRIRTRNLEEKPQSSSFAETYY